MVRQSWVPTQGDFVIGGKDVLSTVDILGFFVHANGAITSSSSTVTVSPLVAQKPENRLHCLSKLFANINTSPYRGLGGSTSPVFYLPRSGLVPFSTTLCHTGFLSVSRVRQA